MISTTWSTVEVCPRCEKRHVELTFHRFNKPVETLEQTYGWYAICPYLKEPMLADLELKEKEERTHANE